MMKSGVLSASSKIGSDQGTGGSLDGMDGSVTQLKKHTKQFMAINYMLEMALAHSNVKVSILQVWDVRNPALVSRFEGHLRKRPGQPSVDCWVDADSLGADNTLESVCQRGFVVPRGSDGLHFRTGSIKTAPPPANGQPSPMHRFLLANVCVGRSYPKVDAAGKNIVPPGYDSLHLYEGEGAGDAGTPGASSTGYSHEFFVPDAGQVLPQYMVYFTTSAITEVDRVRNAKAKEAHHAPQGTDVMGDILDLLDKKLHWSQDSMRTKFHAINALQSELSQASDEYDRALSASRRADEQMEACRSHLNARLETINAKMADVKRNAANVEESIYVMLQDALFQLQDTTQEKLNMLFGEVLEVRRRLEHIDWAEGCLAQFRDELGPPDFVHAWRNHDAVRRNLYKYRTLGASVLDRVHADIKVVGGVQIVTERGPTSALAAHEIGSSFGAQSSKTSRDLLQTEVSTDFRRELFNSSATRSPTRSGDAQGTTSLAASLKVELESKQEPAPNAFAASPVIKSMALPSTQMQTGDAAVTHATGVVPQQSRSPIGGGVSSPGAAGGMEDTWTSHLRAAYGIAAPPPPADDPEPEDATMATTSTPAVPMAAVDDFVAQAKSASQDGVAAPGETKGSNPPPPMAMPPPPPGGPARVGPPDHLKRYKQFAMSTRMARMKRKLNIADLSESHPDILAGSEIVRYDLDKQRLLMCLPHPLNCQLERVQATGNERSLEEIADLVRYLYQDDGTPTEGVGLLMIARSGSHVFGAFAEKLIDSGSHTGTTNSFLYSLTNDMHIPYHGRVKEQKPDNADEGYDGENPNYRQTGWDGVWFDLEHDNVLRFGKTDFAIRGSLDTCSSKIESSYGFGLRTNNPLCGEILAGSDKFSIDELELWLVHGAYHQQHYQAPQMMSGTPY